jgi:L-asparaginase II
MLGKLGLEEEQLACGPHPPLSPVVAKAALRGSVILTPRWSNCSGKHAGMLALARHHGWPTAGYEAAGHPVQQRILREVAAWTGVAESAIPLSVDGCTAVCFALPLRAMAQAYARIATADDPAALRLTRAMMSHPLLVAGTGRLCTDLMAAWPGRVLAKIGAEGVYSAALPAEGIGIALKVEDGDMRVAATALLEVLHQVLHRLAPAAGLALPAALLARHGPQAIRNTRDQPTGELRSAGGLRFPAP